MYQYNGLVTRVVDGDTIDVRIDLGFKVYIKQRIRLFNIDTPEIYRPSSKLELAHGQAAKLFVEERILGKSIVFKSYKDKTGKYGRYLGDIVYADEDGVAYLLTEELKKAGYEKDLKLYNAIKKP